MTMEAPGQCVSALGDESEHSMSSSRARVLAGVHVVLYIVSSALVVDRVTAYWTAGHVHVFAAMVTCLAAAHVTGNCLSLALYFTRRPKRGVPTSCLVRTACVLTHVFQMGPLWRFLSLVGSGDSGNIADLSLVRVVMSMLNDVPFVLLQTSLLLGNERPTWSPVVATVITFCTSLYSISLHNISRTHTKQPRGSLQFNLCKTIGQFTSHFCVLGSRLLTLAIFLGTRGYWLVVLLGAHSLVIVVALYVVNEFTRQKRPVNTRVLLGWSVQLVEWVEVAQGPTSRDLALFYSILGIENFVVAIIFAFSTNGYVVNYILGAIIIMTFVVGVGIRMMLYRTGLSVGGESDKIDKTEMISKRHSDVPISKEIGKPSKEAVSKSLPSHSPRRVILYEHKKGAKRKEHRHSTPGRNTLMKDGTDKLQSPEPASVDDSGFHSKTDVSLTAVASDPQTRCTAEVHASPIRAGHRSHYSSMDEANVTISDLELDFTDTSKILPTSTPKAKWRDEKVTVEKEADTIIRGLQEAYHEKHLRVIGKRGAVEQADKRDSGIHCTDKLNKEEPCSSKPQKENISVSSRTSDWYARGRTCSDTCCDVCDDVSTSLTSSSDFDSFDLAALDLTKTWPPSKKPTIENIEDLPKITIPSKELVEMWLRKCPDHELEQIKFDNELSRSGKTITIV